MNNEMLLATRISDEFGSQVIVALGGGSTLDTGKAIAALSTNRNDLIKYLEIDGPGCRLENPSLPFIAIPTTAGTGSEVTRNAVVCVPELHIKASLRSPYMLPAVAVVDPELTYSLPSSISATTGMDALTQLIEPFICSSPTPLTDILCRDGIVRAARALRIVFEHGQDVKARQDMALASLFGGMALANARLGAVHGMANPVGGISLAPHGAICARLLPLIMETNLLALHSRQPDSPVLPRFGEIASLLTGNPSASAEQGIAWLKDLTNAIGIRPLSEYGLKEEHYQTLVTQSQKSNSMKGNPIILTDAELLAILFDAA